MGVDFPAGFCYNAGKLSFYLSEALLLQYLTNLWNALDFGSLESILLRVARLVYGQAQEHGRHAEQYALQRAEVQRVPKICQILHQQRLREIK